MSKLIINLDKEYGCGGTEIGKILAKRYNIPFYDKEITDRASRESSINLELFKKVEQQQTNSFLYSLAMGAYNYGSSVTPAGTVSMSDRIYLAINETIKNIANEGSAVIMGKCSNYILRKLPDTVNVFVCCNYNDRIDTIMKRENVSEKKAIELIEKSDKKHSSYIKYYINVKNSDSLMKYNDLIINVSTAGIDGAVKLIETFVEIKLGIKPAQA